MSKQLVEQVKAELVARGQKWETNEDAFEITGRVAWLLREHGAMLITKNNAQNGANTEMGRVSHDAIAFPPHIGWKDILVSAGPELNVNGPAWDHTNSSNAVLIAPFDLDAGIVAPAPPVGTPDPLPTPVVPDGIEARLQAVESKLDTLLRLAETPPTYDIPYDIRAGWPIGTQLGTLTMTPRKRS